MNNKRMRVPPEFEKLINEAKNELKKLTGKKRVSNGEGMRFIESSIRFTRDPKFSFETEERK